LFTLPPENISGDNIKEGHLAFHNCIEVTGEPLHFCFYGRSYFLNYRHTNVYDIIPDGINLFIDKIKGENNKYQKVNKFNLLKDRKIYLSRFELIF